MSVFMNQLSKKNDLLDQLEETCIDMLDSLDMLDEDKDDIRSNIAQQHALEKARSEQGMSKRPKITSNMSDYDRSALRNYDHGSLLDTKSNVMSTRNTRAQRSGNKQTANDYYAASIKNYEDAKFYNNGGIKLTGFWAKGTGSAKALDHHKSTNESQADFIREACYTILATLDELED